MTTTEALEAVRGRLAEPDRWTQGTMARRENQRSSVNNPMATSWSLSGALLLEALGEPETRREAAEALRLNAGTSNLQLWNDTHGHAAVIALLDETIDSVGG